MTKNFDATKNAGEVLRRLIQENYASQEDFAYEFGADLRTINRYVNEGVTKVFTIQALAEFFNVELAFFFMPVTENED